MNPERGTDELLNQALRRQSEFASRAAKVGAHLVVGATAAEYYMHSWMPTTARTINGLVGALGVLMVFQGSSSRFLCQILMDDD
jgi:hypothetical protein